jgi:hypothetical protein
MTVRERPEAALPHRFRKEAQPEDRLAGFVGDFYLPLRVIFQIASKIPPMSADMPRPLSAPHHHPGIP